MDSELSPTICGQAHGKDENSYQGLQGDNRYSNYVRLCLKKRSTDPPNCSKVITLPHWWKSVRQPAAEDREKQGKLNPEASVYGKNIYLRTTLPVHTISFGGMAFPYGPPQILNKSASADQVEQRSFDGSSFQQQKNLSSVISKVCTPSSEGETGGRNTGSLRKALHTGHGVQSGLVNDGSDENVVWVVKPPVRLRPSRTPVARARECGNIQVNVRLLPAHPRQKKTRRVREPVKPPAVLSEGRSHFKVYQVQRRGEESAKLVTGKTIHQITKSISQQLPNNGQQGRLGTSPGIQGKENQASSEALPQLSSSHAWLSTGNVSQFAPELSTSKKLSSNVTETANKKADLPSEVYYFEQDRLAKEQHIVSEKATGEERQNEACSSVSRIVSSFLASVKALCPVPISHSAASVDRSQAQRHSPEQQQKAARWEEGPGNTCWTAKASPRSRAEILHCEPSAAQYDSQGPPLIHEGERFSSFHLPLSLEPTASPTPEDPSLSCCADMNRACGTAQNVQGLSYRHPPGREAFSPVMLRLSSPVPAGGTGGDATAQVNAMTEISRSYFDQSAGCMSDFQKACGDWCGPGPAGVGIARDAETRPELTAESHQLLVGETPTAPPQRNFKREFVTVERAPSALSAGDSVKPSVVTERASEGGPDTPQPVTQQPGLLQMSTFERMPTMQIIGEKVRASASEGGAVHGEDTGVQQVTGNEKVTDQFLHTLETSTGKRECAVFLPQRMRPEELRKHDRVPVLLKILHRRRARLEPPLRAVPPPSPRAAKSPLASKQVFHFRVLQQRQPKHDENKRLVTFKAPTHCRAYRLASRFPQRHSDAPSSLDCSYMCASPCSDMAERLTSASSTSSLVTLQYVHRRTYISLPGLPASDVRKEPQELSGKVTVSRFASRIAQEATRRVNRRRLARSARAKARESPRKKADEDHEGEESRKKPRRFEEAQTYTDSLWCCAVRDECNEPQVGSPDSDETTVYSPSTQSGEIETVREGSSPDTPRDTEAECKTPGGKPEALELQARAAGESASALGKESLCQMVGNWFKSGRPGWKGAKINKETGTDLPSLYSEDAIEATCSSRREKDESLDQATTSNSGVFSIVSCCRSTTHEEPALLKEPSSAYSTLDQYPCKTDSGQHIPLPTYSAFGEGAHSPRPGMDYLQAAPTDVTPPLYSLPVVSFLPPVLEPLPVVETVSLCSPAQLPVCCFAIPPPPVQMWTGHHRIEPRNSGSENGSAKTPYVPRPSTSRVRISVLPAREPVTHL